MLVSHIMAYLGSGGLRLYTAFKNCLIMGCSETEVTPGIENTLENALLVFAMEEYPNPLSKREVRYASM